MRAARGTPRVLRNPNREDLRSYIYAQQCWWCGRSGLRVLAQHTSKAHGIMAHDLREMAGLIKGARICDEQHGDACSDRTRRLHKEGRIPAPTGQKGRPHRYSAAGLAVHRNRELTQKQVLVAAKRRIPRTCAVCGETYHSRYGNKACGPTCEAVLRSRNAGRPRGPRRPCVICGIPMDTPPSALATCSTGCRRIRRQQLGRANTRFLLAVTDEQRRVAGRKGAEKNRRPHPCTNGCGQVVPVATRRTCSPLCRREVRQKTQLKSAATRAARKSR